MRMWATRKGVVFSQSSTLLACVTGWMVVGFRKIRNPGEVPS